MSKKYKLPYGETFVEISIPEHIRPFLLTKKNDGPNNHLPDALSRGLKEPIQSPPLSQLAQTATQIGIIVNDVTRPTPTAAILPVVLQEIPQEKREGITIFIATGSHRACTSEEIAQILGEDFDGKFKIIQNCADDLQAYTKVGESQFGNEIFIHSKLLAYDLLISIGFIEPHFFAGFSGGMKNILPGMAGIQSIMANHSVKMIDSPKATWGMTDGNPIWEEVNSVGLLFPQTFLINVTLDEMKNIDGVFCGEADQAYRAGCKFVIQKSMVAVPNEFDIVVTTNSGYPLDINLYQTVKGMSAAAQIIKPGGDIIIFSECRDGIPEHGCYRHLLESADSPEHLLENIYQLTQPTPDQWQAQIQAKILEKANVFIYSDNLNDDQVRACLLNPFHDFDLLLANITAQKEDALSVCIMPEGPLTVPYLQD